MALATLNGLPVPGLNPPWVLVFSHTESLDSVLPKNPLCAQFVKGPTGIHALQVSSAQRIFQLFRSVGPLVSVRTSVDTGYPQRTCVVQYWNVQDADYARTTSLAFPEIVYTMGPFTLRTFTQYSILCSVGGLLQLVRHIPPTESCARILVAHSYLKTCRIYSRR